MNEKLIKFLKYLLVALASAITGYLNSSCTAGMVIGSHQSQRQYQEITTKARLDSTQIIPKLQIN